MSGEAGTERATCRRCARPIARRPGAGRWWHVGEVPRVSCGPAGAGLGAATPTDAGSTLRVLLLALLAAGLAVVDLYDDGFEIGGPDDLSLVFVAGRYTPARLAALLGIDEPAVNDLRAATSPRELPDPALHDLSTVGTAAAWRHPAAPGEPSDRFWLRAFDVEVSVRRHPDGVAVTVDGTAVDPAAGRLVVQVNRGPALFYGRGPTTR